MVKIAITPFNICQGPATLYWGAFGTTEPLDSAVTSAPGAGWTDVGGTADDTPVVLEVDMTYTDQAVDQLVDMVGGRLTKRTVQLTASMEEATLNNLTVATNQLTSQSTQATYSTLDPLTTSSASQPTYTAFIIDGWAPTLNTGVAARRRIIVRKCLTSSKIALSYEKSKPVLFATTWTAYYVSASVPLFHIIDQTA
jgi:hypothetical protein